MKRPTRSKLVTLAAAPLLTLAVVSCGEEVLASTADPGAAETGGEGEADGQAPPSREEESTPTGDDPEGENGADSSLTGPVDSEFLGSYSIANEEYGTTLNVTVDGDTRTFESNSLPDHETGDFTGRNEIMEQELVFEYTTAPVFTGEANDAKDPGIAINGVPFQPGTAEEVNCASGERNRIEALQETFPLGLDFNNAHVQSPGQYHYHGVSELLVDAYASDDDLVLAGFAADGYLMYYSKSGAYNSSYVLSDEARTGTDCVRGRADGGGGETEDADGDDDTAEVETFDLEGTTPDGTYNTDFEYTEGAGELDSCNGTTVDGHYVYFLTDEYPYVPRCLNGEGVAGGAGPGGGGGEGQGQGEGEGEGEGEDEDGEGQGEDEDGEGEGVTPAGADTGEGEETPVDADQDEGENRGGQDGAEEDKTRGDQGRDDEGATRGGGEGRDDARTAGRPDLAAAAATLGITEQELREALVGSPPDLDASAANLGITVDELEAALQ